MYVELKNINKNYGDYKASDDVNFGIERGKLVALLGPSGSGKTTILRMLAGLEYPDSGDIYIDGKRMNQVPASKRGIGFVFQNYALFRYMTVFDNIAFGLEIQKMPKAQIKERVMELVKLVGLEGLEKRYPNQLSGGQRQRIGIARLILRKYDFIVADEITANLDTETSQQIMEKLLKMSSSMLVITHDISSRFLKQFDEVYQMKEGKINLIEKGGDL